ncbi:MAG TPA: hypothetical protein VK106_00135, partial [Balneolaceae bacterium]|nr:hypothetical protein [Balneolaceae bacterium]
MNRSKKRHLYHFRILACLLLILSFSSSCSAQQNIFKRISSAKRADGKGYVIRLHMNEAPDSFAVAQPRPDIIQLEVFGAGIDTADVKKAVIPEFENMSLFALAHGVGVVFHIDGETAYRARAYPDAGGTD